MRRVLLFAAFLLLLGLSTAMAASFDVQAEDITSFTTDVSISVPPSEVTFYIKNDPDQPNGADPMVPGLLDSDPPGNNNVDQKLIIRDAALVGQSQGDPARYHAWQSLPLERTLSLAGDATLYISSNGGKQELIAGLFECWVPVPEDDPQPTTIDWDVTGGVACALIGAGTSSGGTNSSGYTERKATLPLVPTVVEAGHTLRLKVVNNSSADWNLQWGFNPARPSQLELTATG